MTRRLRVMLVCERLDLAGGVERFVCTLASHLAELGHSVSVASGATPAEAIRYPLHPAVRVLRGDRPQPPRVDDGSMARRWRLAVRQWTLGRVLARLARQEGPQVLVLNGLTTACAFLWCAPGLTPRAICCDHNHADARSRPWRWLRRRLYAGTGALVSLTEADRARYAAINPRARVIPNASALRADAPARVEAPRVLAVGRHVAQKGFDLLLQAWAEVVERLPGARLRIVGDGALQPALQAQAEALGIDGSVEWLAPTADIEAHYRAAAVFVLPSRYEGMPLALLEAQALGVPAVAFDCPTGPRDILADDTGILVPAQDTAALANALIRLLADPALRHRMAEAAIRRSRTSFSPELHLARWTALVEQVADAGRVPGR